MNAYEIDIWREIKHNGKFIVNDSRMVTVHARNENEAKNKVTLASPKVTNSAGLKIEVSGEFIYRTTKIGTVIIQKFYVYPNGRAPILVEDFKRMYK